MYFLPLLKMYLRFCPIFIIFVDRFYFCIQRLVDSDYSLLVESMQMLDYSYDPELDADVVSGTVRGLRGYMGGNIALGVDDIIMWQ
jgi:hypothetical protein